MFFLIFVYLLTGFLHSITIYMPSHLHRNIFLLFAFTSVANKIEFLLSINAEINTLTSVICSAFQCICRNSWSLTVEDVVMCRLAKRSTNILTVLGVFTCHAFRSLHLIITVVYYSNPNVIETIWHFTPANFQHVCYMCDNDYVIYVWCFGILHM